ncbi:intracellular septation protein A [Altererythrobacter aerius]|uniref:Inner membrane-spanning protein YciB n=1 Tax=Tsuneonella aeria TaxID=1837929 RepID=A0A6I4TBI0_9SPHN|nr:inner membrane-spanning protein YciB [Tsuneonella aeria]MXO74403.1 intracellular septation protein A [Tsuneonella aeria]
MADDAARKPSGWLNVAVDYGPIIVFLLVYKWIAPGDDSPGSQIVAVVQSTLAFIVAALVALAVSKWKLGRVSPMLWLSTALIVGFGALTIWLRDERFIQLKPTVIYVLFAVALIGGWMRGKALLKTLLGTAFEGLDQAGWLKLSRNWGLFFLVLAGLNEVLRAQLSFENWLWAKLWVFMPLSFLFTFTQIPMLLKHGLASEGLQEEETTPPPTG